MTQPSNSSRELPTKLINGIRTIVHHRKRSKWYFTFVDKYCNNCKRIVPTVVIEWMHSWIRCYYCLMVPEKELPIIKIRKPRALTSIIYSEPQLRNGVYAY